MIEPIELEWEAYTAVNHLQATVLHGFWFIGPPPGPHQMCEIKYQPIENKRFLYQEELLRAASQDEAKIIVGLYERLAKLGGTLADLMAIASFSLVSYNDKLDRTNMYQRATVTAGTFNFRDINREDRWSSLGYEPRRGGHCYNILVASFQQLSYDGSKVIKYCWPSTILNPALVTAAVACEMVERRLANGGRRFRFPVT